jgi:hypothetical protein
MTTVDPISPAVPYTSAPIHPAGPWIAARMDRSPERFIGSASLYFAMDPCRSNENEPADQDSSTSFHAMQVRAPAGSSREAEARTSPPPPASGTEPLWWPFFHPRHELQKGGDDDLTGAVARTGNASTSTRITNFGIRRRSSARKDELRRAVEQVGLESIRPRRCPDRGDNAHRGPRWHPLLALK